MGTLISAKNSDGLYMFNWTIVVVFELLLWETDWGALKASMLFLIGAFMPAYNRCKQTFSRGIAPRPQLLVHLTGNFGQTSKWFWRTKENMF